MTTTDLVSIIVPCYNQGEYLEESIQSAVGQTYPHIEIIIVNDGSTDNTQEIASTLQKEYPTKIQVILQENKGLVTARNNAIKHAIGKYIVPLDADDLLDKDMVRLCLDDIIKHDADVIYVYQQCFGTKEHLIERPPFLKNNLLYQNISGPTALYKRSVWENIGGYAKNMRGGYEDWEFWLHAYKRGYIFKLLPKPLQKYRRHEISMITHALDNDSYLRAKVTLNHQELYTIEYVTKAITVIKKIEGLADLYFYIQRNTSVDKINLSEYIKQYLSLKELEKSQYIDSNKKIILYSLDTLENEDALQKLCINKENTFIIFYSSIRYKSQKLKNLDFAWHKDKGIVKTKGTIFPFTFKNIRENKISQLVAHKQLYRYYTEVYEPKTKKIISICQQRVDNREKTIINYKQRLDNREKTIINYQQRLNNKEKIITTYQQKLDDRKKIISTYNKRIQKKDNLIEEQVDILDKIKKARKRIIKLSIFVHPIKKYKAYKNLIEQI